MMVNIDELKRLDREATQGSWEVVGSRDVYDAVIVSGAKTIAIDYENPGDSRLSCYLRNNTQAITNEIETLRRRVSQLEIENHRLIDQLIDCGELVR